MRQKVLPIFFVFLFIFGFSGAVFSQTTYSSSPAVNTWSGCPASGFTANCGSPAYIYNGSNTIQLRVSSISGNQITFEVNKCAGGNFSANTTFYLKEQNTTSNALADVVCGINNPSAGISVGGIPSTTHTYTASFTSGTKTFVGVTIGPTGTRYYTNPITITASTTCGVPTGLTAGAITTSGFSAMWNAVNGATEYEVEVMECGGFNSTTYTTTILNKYISGLYCGGCYWYRVRANCSGTYSAWTSSNTVNLNSCATPSSTFVSFSNITTNSFTASWPSAANASDYNVNIAACSATSYTNTPISTSGATSYTFSGLASSSDFKIQLQSVCGSSCTSAWSSSSSCVSTTSASGTYTININTPNSGSFTTGQNLPLTWTTTGLTAADMIQFELYNASTNLLQEVLYLGSGTANTGSVNWTIITSIPTGTYYLKAYKVNCGTNCPNDLSGTFTITNTTASPTLTVTAPVSTSTWNCGTTQTITWTTTNLSPSSNMAIELTNTTNATVYTITNGTPNSGSYSWAITNPLPNSLAAGQYKIKVYLVGSGQPNNSSASFNLTCVSLSNCITWSPATPTIGNGNQIDQEAYDAFQYLCAKNIINSSQLTTDIDNNLHRDELAKITFKALFSPNGSGNPFVNGTTTFSDDFPIPYYDLQPPYTTYQKEAKAMCYLEYGDCVSPFDRDFTHFRPADTIWKKHALKEILEAFNIAPAASNAPAPWPSGTYIDVVQGFGEYGYIVKAYQLGIIGNATNFGATTALTRRNAFRYLYKLLQLFDANSTSVGGSKPVPQPSDYYIPFNQRVGNMNNLLGIDEGAFNSYTKTSFGIAGKMPLVFAHSYNSANTNYPNAFYVLQPMGKGWNHNYNCYIKRFDNGAGSDIRFTIFWGDGTMISFDSTATNVFTPLDKGVYSSLAMSNGGNTFTLTTKSKVVYTFNRQTNLNNSFWCLTKINDRNNNFLTIGWQVVTSKYAQVNQVSDPQNRQLNFTYTNFKLSQLQCVTGAITRYVYFTYNTLGDLQTYTDPMGQTSTYIYYSNPTPCEEHLLKQIQLPKGNIIDNNYDKRKLVSSQFAGQYATTVNVDPHYTAGNNTNFSEATISTTQQGSTITTHVKHNELGNTVHIDDPTSNLEIGYNTVGQPNKPSSFTNTTSGITATTEYDAMGNVLNVYKSAPSMPTINESFTYNSFNDVLKYKNANGAETIFTYNGTGNLIGITDALGNNSVIVPNVDGTVQKVTNPSGFYTEYTYDAFGNTKQSTLMGTITSKADYDDASRIILATNPNNVKTKYDYNHNDQVTSVVYDFGNSNNTMGYAYDANGNLIKVTNPKGDHTILTYNNQDQLVQYDFLGLIKKYAYNQNGTLDTFINQNGIVFKNTYNADGTLAGDGYATYGYDATTNNLTTITSNVNTKVLTFGYDNYQRVNSINYNDFTANTVSYEYDNTNNITKITYPGGFAVKYIYDVLGRLYQVQNASSNFVYATYSYHFDGRLQQCVNGNNTKTVYLYDNLGRLDSISNQTSSGTIICAYGFALDNVGNHTSETVNEPFAPSMPVIPSTTVGYTHSNTNRMTNQGSNTTSFNDNGNELVNSGSLNATYTWDEKENLLTSSSPSLSCEYDGAENRRRRNNTRFVLDLLGDNLLMETDLNGNPIAYYIQGLGLVCRLDASQTNPAYYHYDYRGSTTAITNASQVVTHTYLYGAFGEQLAVSETGFANNFRYVGMYGVMYEDSTLYFMRARYYNPNKGRFLGEDPVANKNLYAYGENNPIGLIDANGNISRAPSYKDIVEARDIKRGAYMNVMFVNADEVIAEYESALRISTCIVNLQNKASELRKSILSSDKVLSLTNELAGIDAIYKLNNTDLKEYLDQFEDKKAELVRLKNRKIEITNTLNSNSNSNAALASIPLLIKAAVDNWNKVFKNENLTDILDWYSNRNNLKWSNRGSID